MKKLIASILAIAMIASLFTMVVVPSAAETTYASKVEELEATFNEVIAKTPYIERHSWVFADDAGHRFVDEGELTDERRIGEYYLVPNFQLADHLFKDDHDNWQKALGISNDDFEGYDADIENAKNYYISDEDAFIAELTPVLEAIEFAFEGGIFDDNGGIIPVLFTEDAEEAYDAYRQAQTYILLYAVYAYEFGTSADAAELDAEFNAARVDVYQSAIDALKALAVAFKNQVKDVNNLPGAAWVQDTDENGDPKVDDEGNPVMVRDPENDKGYAAAYTTYKNFSDEAYNPSLGVNAKLYVTGATDANEIFAQLDWYTFEEIEANPAWAGLLAEFNLALRTAYTSKWEGQLYSDFAETADDVVDAFDKLCNAIYAAPKADDNTVNPYENVYLTVTEFLRLYVLMEKVIKADVLPNIDLYSMDSIGINTMVNFLTQVTFAENIIKYATENNAPGKATDPWRYDKNYLTKPSKDYRWKELAGYVQANLVGYDANSIKSLREGLEASLLAMKPVSGQELTSTEIENGFDLHIRAERVLAYTAGDAVIASGLRDELQAAFDAFDAYLPVSATNVVVKYEVPAFRDADAGEVFKVLEGSYNGYKLTDFKYMTGDVFYFVPVAYEYLDRYMALEDALNAYVDALEKASTEAPALPVPEVDTTKLEKLLADYGFLIGYLKNDEGDLVLIEDYLYALTGMTADELAALADAEVSLEEVIEDVELGGFMGIVLDDVMTDSTAAYTYDVATRNYLVLVAAYAAGVEALADAQDAGINWDDQKIDWNSDDLAFILGDFQKAVDKAVANLEAALKLLFVNYSVIIAKYDFVLDDIAYFFELVLDEATATYTSAYDVEMTALDLDEAYWSNPDSYADGEFKKLIAAANDLRQLIARYAVDKDGDLVATYATLADLDAAYAALLDAVANLMTDKGVAVLTNYLAVVDSALTLYYGLNTTESLAVYAVLEMYVGSIEAYFPIEVALRPYEYFTVTLNAVVNWEIPSNIYSEFEVECEVGETTLFEINFYDEFLAEVEELTAIVTGRYSQALRSEAFVLATFANMIIDGISEEDNDFTFDPENYNAYTMPFWYAQKLLATIVAFNDEAELEPAALKVKNAELDAKIELASKIQTVGLTTKTRNAFVKAYEAAQQAAIDVKDAKAYVYSADEIDALVAALDAAIVAVLAENGALVEMTLADVLASVDAMYNNAATINAGLLDTTALKAKLEGVKNNLALNYGNVAQSVYLAEATTAVIGFFAEMEAALAAEKAAYEEVKANADSYTPASFAAVEEAWKAIATITGKRTAPAGVTILTAKADFAAAYAKLVKVTEAQKYAYDNAVATAAYADALIEGLNKDEYTAESYAALVAAAAKLDAAIEEFASEADLQTAIINFKVAEVQLTAADLGEVGTSDN